MSGPFTPEQEARVREIIGEMIQAVERNRQKAALAALSDAVDWAAHEVAHND